MKLFLYEIRLADFQLFLHSTFNVKMESAKIRAIFEYKFRCGTNAVDTARNVNAVFCSNKEYS